MLAHLVRRLREDGDRRGVRTTVVEETGRSVHDELVRGNPTRVERP